MVSGLRKSRKSIAKRLEKEREAKLTLLADRKARPPAHTTLHRRNGVEPYTGPKPDRYKQDSEAYKRRESPVNEVYNLIEQGDRVNGVKVT